MRKLKSILPPHFTLLQVVPELETGGAEQTAVDIAAAVVAAGGRALVASRGGRMAARLAAAGGELIPMPAQSKNPLVQARNARQLAALIRREAVSLVHARSRAPAFAALWAARRTKTPFVATYHGVYNAHSPLKRWYNSIMTKGDAIIANSQFTRDHVIAEHHVDPARVTAIPRGVDLRRFDPAQAPPERVRALRAAWGIAPDEVRPVLLLAGRLTRWKGQLLLIDALGLLAAGGPSPLILVLAGDDQGRGDYRAEVEARAKALGLAEAVRVVGHCEDMPAAYLAADLAAAPSLDPEAFGRTAVEPQIMGRPVLAAAHGAAAETVVDGQTGWLTAPRDAKAWSLTLAKALAQTPAQRAAMGDRAQTRARRLYSLDAMCAATLNVYARLLETQRP